MTRDQKQPIIVIGAGAAGLMAARELARAGRRVTVLEARDRCGGRIFSLPEAELGYRADGGAEFIHGEAPVTRRLLADGGLTCVEVDGARIGLRKGTVSSDGVPERSNKAFEAVLAQLSSDMTVTELLDRHFAGPEFAALRKSIVRMVMGYDAADPARASVLALREEWTHSGRSLQARVVGGYGPMIDYLVADCRAHGVAIHLDCAVAAIEAADEGVQVVCADGRSHQGEVAILTVPLPLLQEITLPAATREVIAAADIGFGNVVKLLLRFDRCWWSEVNGTRLADLQFVFADEPVGVWWTQYPTVQPVLTGWLAGPATGPLVTCSERELIDKGVGSLASMFGLSAAEVETRLVAARAIDWGRDPFARGAYSYATLGTRQAQATLSHWQGDRVLISGEALYSGPDMGTVEAALASGLDTARMLLARAS